jgi:hypothetical protein
MSLKIAVIGDRNLQQKMASAPWPLERHFSAITSQQGANYQVSE